MKKTIRTFAFLTILLLTLVTLVGCGGKVNEKKFEKAFNPDRYDNVQIVIETYKGTFLKKSVYSIENDIIKLDVYNYDGDTLSDSIHQYYKDLGDGTSEGYSYVSTTSTWAKLDEKSEITREFILQYLTDFADSDINSYTYNKEFKEYVKMTDEGLVELVFENGKLKQAMNNYKVKVSGTKISFLNYGLVRDLSLPVANN